MNQWEKNKLTPKKVLAVIRRYITSQHIVPRKEVALVKTSYGFKLKQYALGYLIKCRTRRQASTTLCWGVPNCPYRKL